MHNGDYREEWEDYPDDWYDGADEILLRAHRVLLQMCYEMPCASKEGGEG